MHSLKLYVDQLVLDLNNLIIRDISIYNPQIAKTAPILQIKAPNMTEFKVITGLTWAYPFVFNIDSVKLFGNTTAQPLVDGIYQINYSLSPHATINTTLNFFRVESLRKLILEKAANYFYDDIEIDPFGNMKKDKAAEIINTCYLGMRAVQSKTSFDAEMIEAYELYDRIVKLIKTL